MPEAVIVDTVRTPIGRAFKGSLAQLRPEETGAYVIDQLLERNQEVDPTTVNEVFAGCGMPQGLQAFNVARIMTLLSEKLENETTAVTMSRYCASSLDAIRHAANAIKAGEGDTYVAAGVEWVSRFNERTEPAGVADRNPNLIGENGQPNAYIDMGITAVNVAKRYEVRGKIGRLEVVRPAAKATRVEATGTVRDLCPGEGGYYTSKEQYCDESVRVAWQQWEQEVEMKLSASVKVVDPANGRQLVTRTHDASAEHAARQAVDFTRASGDAWLPTPVGADTITDCPPWIARMASRWKGSRGNA